VEVAKITEIKASSPTSFEDAVKTGIARAHKTLRNITSAWVKDFEVLVNDNGEVSEFRVLLKVTFILEDSPD
jgi:dodecin